MKNKIITNILIVSLFILLGILSRAIPHPWNFTPILAIALVLSVYLGWKYSVLGMFLIMIFSDALIGFYDFEVMLAVYACLLMSIAFGTFIQRKKPSTILLATLGGSLLFFFVTNWAVWQFGTMYPHTFNGFINSYTMALPFFKNSLIGDIFYTATFFATFEIFIFLKNKMLSKDFSGLELK